MQIFKKTKHQKQTHHTSQHGKFMILLDSFIRVNKKYYPQTLLKVCKYKIKKNIMVDVDLSMMI